MRRIDPRAADQRNPRAIDAKPGQRGAVFRVLHDDMPAARGKPQRPAEQTPLDAGECAPRGKPTTEPHDSREPRRHSRAAREGEPRRERAEQHRL